MDKVLIFGINGFTGRHFVRYTEEKCITNRYLITGADRNNDCISGMPVRRTDLLESGNVENIIREERPDYIVNFVGSYESKDFEMLRETNAGISRRICEGVLQEGLQVKKILLIGSAAEYGLPRRLPVSEKDEACPITYYGLTKLIQTNYAQFYFRAHHLNIVLARPFNIIGKDLPESLAFGSFVRQIMAAQDRGEISAGNLNARRDFLDIDDVIDAYWKILMTGSTGEIYNICSGASLTIQSMLDYAIKMSGKELRIVKVGSLKKDRDVDDICGDNTKLKSHTGWSQNVTAWEALDRMLS